MSMLVKESFDVKFIARAKTIKTIIAPSLLFKTALKIEKNINNAVIKR